MCELVLVFTSCGQSNLINSVNFGVASRSTCFCFVELDQQKTTLLIDWCCRRIQTKVSPRRPTSFTMGWRSLNQPTDKVLIDGAHCTVMTNISSHSGSFCPRPSSVSGSYFRRWIQRSEWSCKLFRRRQWRPFLCNSSRKRPLDILEHVSLLSRDDSGAP